MYEDLFQFLVPGFLTARVLVDGRAYSLRSLTTSDLFRISAVAKDNHPDWKIWAVASSLWMVDGIPLFEDSTYAPKAIFETLLGSHKRLVSHLFGTVVGFFLRSKRSHLFLESFLYEEESRNLWHSTHSGQIPLYQRSGIPGIERLGLNQFQSSWVAWNKLEDTRDGQEYTWSLTKLMVSLQSHKAAQKLEARDKNRHETERSRRRDVQEKAYRIFLGEVDPEGNPLSSESGLVFRAPRTNAELVDEMRRWVSGDMDDHDRIVAEYKERIRNEYLANEVAKDLALRDLNKRREEERVAQGSTRTGLVAYTPKEIQEKFPQLGKPGAKFVVEADPVSRTFNRYLRDEPEALPGILAEDRPVEDPPLSLNELIASRKPRFHGE
jgi:hypothetical protein